MEEDPEASPEVPGAHKSYGLPMRADMSVLRVTFDTTLRELTIKYSNVISATKLQVLRVCDIGENLGPLKSDSLTSD